MNNGWLGAAVMDGDVRTKENIMILGKSAISYSAVRERVTDRKSVV